MAGNKANPNATVFVEQIEEAEQHITAYAAFLKQLKSRLSRAKKALTSKPDVASQVATLLSDLKGMKSDASPPVVSKLSDSLSNRLKSLRHRLQESFPAELRRGCEAAHLSFSALSDGFVVGSFLVTVSHQKETALFHYAKTEIDEGVPLSVQAIVERAQSIKDSLLDQPVDIDRFGDELDEAMRVAAARQSRTTRAELRVELPAIFRELAVIRKMLRTKRKSARAEYSLARFVVELKQFVQSDQNLQAKRQFHLETAVLENTKNPKKSVFIPRDLKCGFGEGTYYQAIVLR